MSNSKKAPKSKISNTRYVFKVKLRGVTKPPVWRKIEVPNNITFKIFSDAIRSAMGWFGCHLWHFTEQVYSEPAIALPREDDWDKPIDASKTKINQQFNKIGDKMLYTYDFGDDWIHDVVLEEIKQSNETGCFVVDAKGKCPPEDCGGPWGYENLKKILNDPKNEEYEDMLEWLGLKSGEEWNPKEADVEPGEPIGDEPMDWDEA